MDEYWRRVIFPDRLSTSSQNATQVLNLVEITPAATDTGVINDVNSFANAGAATFSIDVTLYLWLVTDPLYTIRTIRDLPVR